MAKSKNHTNHNKSRKDHKNGIDKPKRCRFPNRLGVCQKFKLNLRYARKHQVSPAKQQKLFLARQKLRELRAHKVVAQPPSMK